MIKYQSAFLLLELLLYLLFSFFFSSYSISTKEPKNREGFINFLNEPWSSILCSLSTKLF